MSQNPGGERGKQRIFLVRPYLYFCVKQPYGTKINVTRTILSLQTLEMAHFDRQYQTVKMRS